MADQLPMRNQKSSQGCSDASLLHRAMAGDEDAFLVLYERLKNSIFRYAFYMTNSKASAEEVTQEVFISLLKEGNSYREDRGDLGAFAFGIARNFVRRIERRERAYHPLPPDDTLESSAPRLVSEPATGQVIRDEVAERVQIAIASLPDHYRHAVVLCDLCELSYTEAASRLQCAVGTIRSRLNRAHTLLAQKLKPLRNSQPDIEAAGTERCLI
jgi:RNA polymerase sigma-70 factor (ECF subfamily)